MMPTETLRPNGVGTNSENTPVGDTPNWECVDEETADDDTTYVYKGNSGWARDTYAMQDHSVGSGTINKVTVYIRCKEVTIGYGRTVIRTGGSEYEGAVKALTGAWLEYNTEYATNPKTGSPWTWAEVDALEAGVDLAGYLYDSRKGLCTQVWVVVDYSPVAARKIYGDGLVTIVS